MSNWSLYAATRVEALGAGTGEGVTHTASLNAKAAYTTIGTTGFAYSGFHLSVVAVTSARFAIDIAVTDNAAERIIIENLFLDGSNSTNEGSMTLWVPIQIPSGSVVRVRAAASASSATLRVMVVGYAADYPHAGRFSRLVALPAFTDLPDPNTAVDLTGTTFTAWTEITASSSVNAAALYLSGSTDGTTTRTATRLLIDIGTGAAGSEVRRYLWQTGQTTNAVGTAIHGPIWCSIASGTRLAFRAQCATAGVAQPYAINVMALVP